MARRLSLTETYMRSSSTWWSPDGRDLNSTLSVSSTITRSAGVRRSWSLIDIQLGNDRFHATLYLRAPTVSDYAQSFKSQGLTPFSRRKVLGIRLQQAANLYIICPRVRGVGNALFGAWVWTLIIFEDVCSRGA